MLVAVFIVSSHTLAQWKSLNGPIKGSIECIMQQKINPEETIFYIGSSKGGVYLSRDYGNSWETTGISNKWITDMINTGDVIYAGTKDDGIFRSYDEGLNWKQINNGLTIKNVTALSFVGSKIFAATSHYTEDFNYEEGIYFSTDDGNTWNRINSIQNAVSDIANYNNKMFAISLGNIYFSNDYGNSWTPINSPIGAFCITMNESKVFIGTHDGVYISSDYGINWNQRGLASECDHISVDNDTLFAAFYGKDIYRSTDNGENWEPTGLNDPSLGIVNKTDRYTIAGSIDGDIYLSIDLGNNWFELNSSPQFQQVNTVKSNGNNIFAGTGYFDMVSGNGKYLYYSTNNGRKWKKVDYGIIDYAVSSIFINQENIYAGTYLYTSYAYNVIEDGKIYLSTNNGKNWSQLGLENKAIASLLVDSSKVFAGIRGGVCFSTDDGINWLQYNLNGIISSLIKYEDKIFAGSYEGLYISSDGGISWSKISDLSVKCLVSDGQYIYVGNYDGVFKSSNNGIIFSQIGSLPTNSIAFYNNSIYICSDDGLYVSKDEGLTWGKIITDNLLIHNIFIKNDTLTGYGRGIYLIPISDIIISVDDNQNYSPHNYSLDQNYPNPFNPTTNIKFEIPQTILVSIDVFDILGSKVVTLLNEEKTAGTYNISFNALNLSSGIYFYQMKAGNYTQTKKMILLK